MSTEVEDRAANHDPAGPEGPLSGDPAVTLPAADVARAHLKGLIEALVFVSEHPLSVNEIAKAAGEADKKVVRNLADELRQEYARRGIHLDEVAGADDARAARDAGHRGLSAAAHAPRGRRHSRRRFRARHENAARPRSGQ